SKRCPTRSGADGSIRRLPIFQPTRPAGSPYNLLNHLNSLHLTLEPADNERLASLCGQFDEHLRQIERRLGVEIANCGNHFEIIGSGKPVEAAYKVLQSLFDATSREVVTPEHVHLSLQDANIAAMLESSGDEVEPLVIRTKRGAIKPRGTNQQRY